MHIFCKEELGAKQSLSEPRLAFCHFACGLGLSLWGHCLISSSNCFSQAEHRSILGNSLYIGGAVMTSRIR